MTKEKHETEENKNQNIHDKFQDIDGKLTDIYLTFGKLDSLANLIDLRSDNTEWQSSEKCQFAISLCCEMIEKLSKDFSDASDEFQNAINEARAEYVPATVVLNMLQSASNICNSHESIQTPDDIRSSLYSLWQGDSADRIAIAWSALLQANGIKLADSRYSRPHAAVPASCMS